MPEVPAGSQTLDTVNVGTVSGLSDAAFLIAAKKGYFRDVGIDVKFIPFKSAADMIAPLGTGQLDAGGGAPSAGLYNAMTRGVALRIVADRSRSSAGGFGSLPLLVRKDLVASGRYKTVADLKGLKFAEPSKGNATIATVVRLLQTGGLQYNDITHVYLGFPEQIAALANGGIDATLALEPFATQAVANGSAVRIAGNDSWYPNQQIGVLIYGDEFITKRAELAKRFMVAYVRALRYYADALKGGHIAGPNAPDVLAMFNESIKVSDPEIFRKMTCSTVDPTGRVNVASLRFDYDQIKGQGFLDGDVNFATVVDPRIVDYANGVLGAYRAAR
jgi:NitT/TauT family transport system substrate-binding protein